MTLDQLLDHWIHDTDFEMNSQVTRFIVIIKILQDFHLFLWLRKFLFQLLNSHELVPTKFVTMWLWLGSEFRKLTARYPQTHGSSFTEQLLQVGEKIDNWIKEQDYMITKNSLWEFGGHPRTYGDKVLFELDLQLRSIATKLELNSLDELSIISLGISLIFFQAIQSIHCWDSISNSEIIWCMDFVPCNGWVKTWKYQMQHCCLTKFDSYHRYNRT